MGWWQVTSTAMELTVSSFEKRSTRMHRKAAQKKRSTVVWNIIALLGPGQSDHASTTARSGS
jgi:hypothetical protein